MNHRQTSFLVTASLIAMAATAQAAPSSTTFELDPAYSEMSPNAGEDATPSGEIDHNLDTMPPATLDDQDKKEAGTPAAFDRPGSDLAVKREQTIAVPPMREKPAKTREIPLIETHNDNSNAADVTYVTGGIGQDEKEAIEASKSDYNLYIMSASSTGAFVGDAHVLIARKNGATTQSMLKVVAGPLLYVKLPAGNYQLEATLGGQVKKQAITIGRKDSTQNIHLAWKVPATLSQ